MELIGYAGGLNKGLCKSLTMLTWECTINRKQQPISTTPSLFLGATKQNKHNRNQPIKNKTATNTYFWEEVMQQQQPTFAFKYSLMKKLVVSVLSGILVYFFEIIEWKIEHLCALNVGKQFKPHLFDLWWPKIALTYRSQSNGIKCIKKRLN